MSKKDTGFYDFLRYKGQPNLDTITDHAEHRERRKVWDKSLNIKCKTLTLK